MADGHVALMDPAKTWSKATYDNYKNRGDFNSWTLIYNSYGDWDYWNPYVPGVKFP